jgi:hypothetical protein
VKFEDGVPTVPSSEPCTATIVRQFHRLVTAFFTIRPTVLFAISRLRKSRNGVRCSVPISPDLQPLCKTSQLDCGNTDRRTTTLLYYFRGNGCAS